MGEMGVSPCDRTQVAPREGGWVTKHPGRWTPAHATPKHQTAGGSSARGQGWALSAERAWTSAHATPNWPVLHYSQALK